jgi:hypothetical protein
MPAMATRRSATTELILARIESLDSIARSLIPEREDAAGSGESVREMPPGMKNHSCLRPR